MAKIGICGHFGIGKNLINGQTIKSKTILNVLEHQYSKEEIIVVDTYNWKKHPLKLIRKCLIICKKCKNVLVLPAHNGIKVFIPLYAFLSRFYKIKLHYIVVGGWLLEMLRKEKIVKKLLKKFTLYVETQSMVMQLRCIGIEKAFCMPNCKEIDIASKEVITTKSFRAPFKFCTFSRVMKEKGIEDAIDAVIALNKRYDRDMCALDIYGPIEVGYYDEFMGKLSGCPKHIAYKGEVNYSDSVNVLSNYYCLLFPTLYSGEGFPGTLIDAFAAGVPTIASNWRYNSEIIGEASTGFLYDTGEKRINNLIDKLEVVISNTELIRTMRQRCLKEARKYLPNEVIKVLCGQLV